MKIYNPAPIKLIRVSISKAKDNHIQDILKRIETDIDYRFTDEAIIEDILANEYEYLSNGKQY